MQNVRIVQDILIHQPAQKDGVVKLPLKVQAVFDVRDIVRVDLVELPIEDL